MNRPYRRRQGERVTYTTAQTAHYKSLVIRWRKGQAMRPIRTQRDLDNPNKNYHYYPSGRSPTGFWKVTVTEKEDEPPPPPPGGGGGMMYPCLPMLVGRVRFSGSSRSTYDAKEEIVNSSPRFESSTGGGSFITAWYPIYEGDAIVELSETFSAPTIETGPSGTDYGGTVSGNQRSVNIYRALGGGYVYIALSSVTSSFSSAPNSFGSLSVLRTIATSITPEFETNDGEPLPNTCAMNPGGPPPPDPFDEDEPEYTFGCDCPDVTRQQGAVAYSSFRSLRRLRSWSGSGAGSPGKCKHIFASQFYLRLDPPMPGSEGDRERRRQRNLPDTDPLRFDFQDPPVTSPPDDFDPYNWRRERFQRQQQERANAASDRANFGNLNRRRYNENRGDRIMNEVERYLNDPFSNSIDSLSPEARAIVQSYDRETYIDEL